MGKMFLYIIIYPTLFLREKLKYDLVIMISIIKDLLIIILMFIIHAIVNYFHHYLFKIYSTKFKVNKIINLMH